MYECRRLIHLALALLAIHNDERRLRVLAGDVREERARQESAEENRRPRVRGDSDERAQHQGHQDDIGDVVEPREVVLDVAAEQRGEEPFREDRGEDSHGDRGDNRAAN